MTKRIITFPILILIIFSITLFSVTVVSSQSLQGEFDLVPFQNKGYVNFTVPYGRVSASQSSLVLDGVTSPYNLAWNEFSNSYKVNAQVIPSQGGAQSVFADLRFFFVFSFTLPDYIDLSQPVTLSFHFITSKVSPVKYITNSSPLLFISSSPQSILNNIDLNNPSYQFKSSDVSTSDYKSYFFNCDLTNLISSYNPGDSVSFGLFCMLTSEYAQAVFQDPLQWSIGSISSSLHASYDLTGKQLSDINSSLDEINENLEYIKDPYANDYQMQLEINNSKVDLSEQISIFDEEIKNLEYDFTPSDVDLSTVNTHLSNSSLLEYFTVLYNIPIVISIFTVLGGLIAVKVLLHGGS